MSEKWRQKLQALLYDYRHSASDRALEHQVKISFCLSRKIVGKKLDDVGQCREGKWEQSTVTILSMWTNNAWLNRTSILQTWPVGSNQKALGRGIQARRQIFLILVTLEILEILLQSTHTYDTRQTNRKEKKICIGSTNWQKLTASVPLNLAQCLLHPKPKQRKEERKATDAPCAPPRSQQLVIWNDTFLFIPERSSSSANSVNTNAHRLVPSINTCWRIQERSLSLACSVSSPARELIPSNNTC